MLNNPINVDFVIIGAGIIGLSIARELLSQHPHAKIAVVDKEHQIGLHASGRNSGVLHSGIYYKEDSLKARFCLSGARAMTEYCDEHGLPINRIGKVILPIRKSDGNVLELLYQRAKNNGARVQLINDVELQELEPEAVSAIQRALFSPETSVVDPKAILMHIYRSLESRGVQFFFGSVCSKIDIKLKTISIGDRILSYGHLFNTAGLFADVIARQCGLKDHYIMIPFKGLYQELVSHSPIRINHLIYPVPDLNVPFLGIHFTKSVHGKVYIGPTAIPALGREHYKGIEGIKLQEAWVTLAKLGQQYLTNKQGFRDYAHHELARFMKLCFMASAKRLIPRLKKDDMIRSQKVGIRAQLFDVDKKELVMDFLVKKTENETHVLNAVSPGFTSAFSFAKFVVHQGL